MRDRDPFAKLLQLEAPWFVPEVDTNLDEGLIEVFIAFDANAESVSARDHGLFHRLARICSDEPTVEQWSEFEAQAAARLALRAALH